MLLTFLREPGRRLLHVCEPAHIFLLVSMCLCFHVQIRACRCLGKSADEARWVPLPSRCPIRSAICSLTAGVAGLRIRPQGLICDGGWWFLGWTLPARPASGGGVSCCNHGLGLGLSL